MSLGVCSGLTQGFSILIAQQYGAKNVREMKRSLAVSLVLSLAAAVVLAALFLLLSRPVLTWMGTWHPRRGSGHADRPGVFLPVLRPPHPENTRPAFFQAGFSAGQGPGQQII